MCRPAAWSRRGSAGESAFACGPVSKCLTPNAGDFFQGQSCSRAADCPTGTACCNRMTPNGGHWATCAASCSDGTVVETGTVQPGQACTSNASCTSNACLGGFCCANTCEGPCNASCQAGTGACVHKPARTACGVKTGPGGVGGGTDVQLICDGAGTCYVPTITCTNPPGGPVSCNLNSSACCVVSTGSAGESGVRVRARCQSA